MSKPFWNQLIGKELVILQIPDHCFEGYSGADCRCFDCLGFCNCLYCFRNLIDFDFDCYYCYFGWKDMNCFDCFLKYYFDKSCFGYFADFDFLDYFACLKSLVEMNFVVGSSITSSVPSGVSINLPVFYDQSGVPATLELGLHF